MHFFRCIKKLMKKLIFIISIFNIFNVIGSSIHFDSDYIALKKKAIDLAGAPHDVYTRIEKFIEIFKDSGENHEFPVVAMHGAAWLKSFYLRSNQKAYKYCQFSFPLNQESCLKKVRSFTEPLFKEMFRINRDVFIDTYTLYYYSKKHPEKLPQNLVFLGAIHKGYLTKKEKREVFRKSLLHEQKFRVSKKMISLYENIPLVAKLLIKTSVRFKYFPNFHFFLWRNYFSETRRIKDALIAHKFAQSVGFPKVISSIYEYDIDDLK